MRILDKLLGKTKTNTKDQDPEQSVIIEFLYGIDDLDPLHRLEVELEKTIRQEGVGEYDGHEIAMDGSDGYLYMYGPSAEILFKTVLPILEQTDFMRGALANLRFGPLEDGVREFQVKIKD